MDTGSSDSDVQICDQSYNIIPVDSLVDDSSRGFGPNIHYSSHHTIDSGKLAVPVDDFNMCMEQAQVWVEKARMISKEKQNAFGNCKMVQNILLEEFNRRNEVIQGLQRDILREQINTSQQVNRLNRELHMMGKAIMFYRDKLKDVNREFSKYRATHVPSDHTLWDNAVGSGGPLVRTEGLGKACLNQEDITASN